MIIDGAYTLAAAIVDIATDADGHATFSSYSAPERPARRVDR
ncbi:hypothetical protein Rhow_006662 [Rhodococcus wratislaviensis]|uniref:Uncharacterized protein n=1 Tax=Rhodococcus wratislaviensis TaxID=44752 RepID=A0A402CG08_RHOWR|nr:hypothetical protein [Rhodococcus wratislaviensis]GCE42533.1 hypothetical protein Rhow_006662 [Rhodococcus wratislaviensis]